MDEIDALKEIAYQLQAIKSAIGCAAYNDALLRESIQSLADEVINLRECLVDEVINLTHCISKISIDKPH